MTRSNNELVSPENSDIRERRFNKSAIVTIARSVVSLQLVYVARFVREKIFQTEHVCVACFHRLLWISLRCSSGCKFQFDDWNDTAVCLI